MDCKNCNTPLTNTSGFCNECGAKVIKNRLTIKALFSHFSEEFLNYDNKFLKTFTHLFTKPETVIGCYINGTRKKYVNVISYFAIALTITGLEWYLFNTFFPHLIDMSAIAVDGSEIETTKSIKLLQEYVSVVMMLFVPLYALMSRIVFLKNKKYNYTEHLVIFMYILAQISLFSTFINLIGAVFGVSLGVLTYINGPFQILYSAYCLKRLYKLSFQGIILKTLLFFGILLFFMIALIVAGFIAAIIFKDSELVKAFIESQEAIKQSKGG